MARHVSADSRNHLLRSLSKADFRLIEQHLQPVSLPIEFGIERPGRVVKSVYFPQSGIVSVVATSPGGSKIEVGLIGPEGMTGLCVLLGDGRSASETFVQVSGQGLKLNAQQLRAAVQKSPSMQTCFLRYAQSFMTQITYTALANGRAKIDERLARWILMAHDRLGQDEVPLTHDFLALMLGVHRPGLTHALHRLRKRSLIDMGHAAVIVVNRRGLEKLARGMYGTAEAESRRLTGWRGFTAISSGFPL
jgi:CRP-like cAMP-binding protein